ncbi:MAG: transposase [bacterium]
MPEYRRLKLPHHPVFITIVTFNRNPILIKNIQLLRESFKVAKQKHIFEIFASVVLPDHMHLILNLDDLSDYSSIISLVKSNFSKNIDENELLNIKEQLTASKIKKREKGVWQRRFIEHTIRDKKDLYNHLNYIHYNPVQHGLVKNARDWEYSSFQKFVKKKWYEVDWGSLKDIKGLGNLNVAEYD